MLKDQGEIHPDFSLWGVSQVPCMRFHYKELEKSGQQLGSTGKLRTSFCVVANGSLSHGRAGWEGTNSPFCFAVHDKEPHDAAGQPRAGRRERDPAAPLLQRAGLGPAEPAADGAPLQAPHCTWGGGWREGIPGVFFPLFGSISRFIPVRQERGEGRELRPLALAWLMVGHLVSHLFSSPCWIFKGNSVK